MPKGLPQGISVCLPQPL